MWQDGSRSIALREPRLDVLTCYGEPFSAGNSSFESFVSDLLS